MRSLADLQSEGVVAVPKVPSWARARGYQFDDANAAYLVGAAMNSLDSLVRAEKGWAGVWRGRLALKAAGALVQLSGRVEEEAALRDAITFRSANDDPGPSGRVLLALRRLANRSTDLCEDQVRHVAELLEIKWNEELSEIVANAEEMVTSARPAPFIAAEIAAELCRARPDAEPLGFWLADAILAQKFRWPVPVPLLASQALDPVFKSAERRRRIRPGDDGWGRAALLAYAKAAAEACDLGVDLAHRTDRLLAVAPKLRSKGSGDIVRLLLDEDAVPGSWSNSRISARGARRLFDRLQELGVVRELSGRPTFRLYGL